MKINSLQIGTGREKYATVRKNLTLEIQRDVWNLLEDPVIEFFATVVGLNPKKLKLRLETDLYIENELIPLNNWYFNDLNEEIKNPLDQVASKKHFGDLHLKKYSVKCKFLANRDLVVSHSLFPSSADLDQEKRFYRPSTLTNVRHFFSSTNLHSDDVPYHEDASDPTGRPGIFFSYPSYPPLLPSLLSFLFPYPSFPLLLLPISPSSFPPLLPISLSFPPLLLPISPSSFPFLLLPISPILPSPPSSFLLPPSFLSSFLFPFPPPSYSPLLPYSPSYSLYPSFLSSSFLFPLSFIPLLLLPIPSILPYSPSCSPYPSFLSSSFLFSILPFPLLLLLHCIYTVFPFPLYSLYFAFLLLLFHFSILSPSFLFL